MAFHRIFSFLLIVLFNSCNCQNCLTEHIVQPNEDCPKIWEAYGLTEEQFSLINHDANCESLEPGTTICVKEKPHSSTPPTSTTTREPEKKNVLESIISDVFGEDRKVPEPHAPLLYHPFPDFAAD